MEVLQITTTDYNFFLGIIYFKGDHGPQNIFVYQPTFNYISVK